MEISPSGGRETGRSHKHPAEAVERDQPDDDEQHKPAAPADIRIVFRPFVAGHSFFVPTF